MSEAESCTFTVIRTSDAERKEITYSLSKKLGELKETLAEEFGVSGQQRLFYMGRELKSGGRSLQTLGLGKAGNKPILHMHISPTTTTSKSAVSGSKRRRAQALSINQVSSDSSGSGATRGQEGIIEIIDSDDDEILKRRR